MPWPLWGREFPGAATFATDATPAGALPGATGTRRRVKVAKKSFARVECERPSRVHGLGTGLAEIHLARAAVQLRHLPVAVLAHALRGFRRRRAQLCQRLQHVPSQGSLCVALLRARLAVHERAVLAPERRRFRDGFVTHTAGGAVRERWCDVAFIGGHLFESTPASFAASARK